MFKQLHPSRLKHAIYMALSMAFVALGIFLLREHPIAGWLNILFFGICAAVFAINLFPQSGFLELTPKGFTVKCLYRSFTTEWQDVGQFFVARVGGREMVCWNYSDNYDRQQLGRAFSRGIAGVEAALPDTYGRTAEQLATLLNEHRLASGARPNNSFKPTPLRGAA